MKKEITTSIIIHAGIEHVWSALTDFASFPNWNPFITSINGKAEEGARITVRIHPPQSKPMTFKPVVLSCLAHKELRWKGKLLVGGLFDGEHIFELSENTADTTLFIQRELFSGILVGMMNLENTRKGFEAMNRQLKALVEKSGSAF